MPLIAHHLVNVLEQTLNQLDVVFFAVLVVSVDVASDESAAKLVSVDTVRKVAVDKVEWRTSVCWSPL